MKSKVKYHNSSKLKVKLVELYFEGKNNKLNNVSARKILEEAYYSQKNVNARKLLAYVYANGIGGDYKKDEALNLFKQEYENNNPDPMVYIELSKLLPKDKENSKNKKILISSVTKLEKNTYNKKRILCKAKNSTAGKIATAIPSATSSVIEILNENHNKTEEAHDMYDLYKKACNLYDKQQYEQSREIFRRLSGYGDRDSELKYAKMAYKGLGGSKDVKTARKIYENIINEQDKKLFKYRKRIKNTNVLIRLKNDEINKLKHSKSDVIKNKFSIIKLNKEIKELNEEIEYLNDKLKETITNVDYNSAMLNLGILLVDNVQDLFKNRENRKHNFKNWLNENPKISKDFTDGILYLKYLAKERRNYTYRRKKIVKIR